MKHWLDGSGLLTCCGKVAQKIQESARESRLLRRWERTFSSAIAEGCNCPGVARFLQGQMAKSALLSWVYHYWGNLCASPCKALLLLLVPLLLLPALWMGISFRWSAALVLVVAAALAVLLLWRSTSLIGFFGSAKLLAKWPIPQGVAALSVKVYLGVCGLLGGMVALFFGATYGLLGGVVLAVLPALFRLPPLWAVCLLCGALPLLPTAACAVLSVGIIVLYFFARAFGGEQGKPVDKIDLLFALFPLLCIGSAIFSFDQADSFKVLGMWMSLYLCIFVVRRVVRSRGRLIAALSSLAIGASASGLIGVLQFLSGQVDTTWTDVELFQSLDLRVYSTFENPNVYGEFLLLVLPLVAGLAIYCQGRWRRLLWVAEGLLLLNLVLTYSRGCYVGLLLTAVAFLWRIHKRWTIASLALGVPIALLVLPQSVLDRIASIGNMNDGSTAFRIYIYIGVAAMLAHYWLGGIGIGEGAFAKVYPKYAIPSVSAPHSHSLIFQTVISFGVAGLVYLYAVLASFQKAIAKAQAKASGKERYLLIGFGAVLWGFLLQSVFDYTWYNYRVFQLFWIVLALGFSAAETTKGETK